jgi:DNA-binding NarL/FixJ family response regulator
VELLSLIPGSCNAHAEICGDAENPVSLRCLIVDDSEHFLRAASASLGRNGIEIVGTATTSDGALERVAELRPDVVLVDVGLGDESGFDLTRRLVDAFPYLGRRVVLISTHGQEDLADLVDSSPVAGFISKSELSAGTVRELVPVDDS